tara:strand:+ start:1127 stop:1477 length:351 start_codon:yes stop_codon:yes gene_type:complete
MADFDHAEFKRKPGESVAQASVRIAGKYDVERQTARNWVVGHRDPEAGLIRLKKSRAMDENLRVMMAFASPGWTYTLDDIAECIGCSKERVRQIQDSALRKLRKRTDYLKKELRKQ